MFTKFKLSQSLISQTIIKQISIWGFTVEKVIKSSPSPVSHKVLNTSKQSVLVKKCQLRSWVKTWKQLKRWVSLHNLLASEKCGTSSFYQWRIPHTGRIMTDFYSKITSLIKYKLLITRSLRLLLKFLCQFLLIYF